MANWDCYVYKHLPDLILNGWSQMDFWSKENEEHWLEEREKAKELGGGSKSITLQKPRSCSQAENIFLLLTVSSDFDELFSCKEKTYRPDLYTVLPAAICRSYVFNASSLRERDSNQTAINIPVLSLLLFGPLANTLAVGARRNSFCLHLLLNCQP